jgi:hypothetical protein
MTTSRSRSGCHGDEIGVELGEPLRGHFLRTHERMSRFAVEIAMPVAASGPQQSEHSASAVIRARLPTVARMARLHSVQPSSWRPSAWPGYPAL